MKRWLCVAGLAVSLAFAAGCTAVQKGSAAGGLLGGATGAAIGHYGSGVGGSAGGLAGLGLGAAGGALAAEYFYGSKDSAEIAELSETIDRLSQELDETSATLSERDAEILRQQAQGKALLEAYEKAKQQGTAQTNLWTPGEVPYGVEVTREGDSIKYTIMSEVLFDSGKAELTSAGKRTLSQALGAVRDGLRGGEVEVCGHTDNVPIKYSSYKSNWHLSCARAVAVVEYLIAEGFDPQTLRASGFSDTRPVASNSTPAGRSKNRRAEIVVRPAGATVASAGLSR